MILRRSRALLPILLVLLGAPTTLLAVDVPPYTDVWTLVETERFRLYGNTSVAILEESLADRETQEPARPAGEARHRLLVLGDRERQITSTQRGVDPERLSERFIPRSADLVPLSVDFLHIEIPDLEAQSHLPRNHVRSPW